MVLIESPPIDPCAPFFYKLAELSKRSALDAMDACVVPQAVLTAFAD
jgi:hypothetical protein